MPYLIACRQWNILAIYCGRMTMNDCTRSGSLKICIIEACDNYDAGSIGAYYIAEHARRAGYNVDVLRSPKAGYDIELISVHHCTDFSKVAMMPKRARYRIIGGHPMQNNPRPIIPFADAVCVGEGESWIGKALKLLEKHDDINALSELPGTIISKNWKRDDPIPDPNFEKPLPDNPPYLNHAGTRRAAWYIEIARGCPYNCKFCELGNSSPFRYYSEEHLHRILEMADTSATRKINFYAPDEVSHPHYHELFAYLMQKGYAASFSSMRIDSILRRGVPPEMKRNHLIRVGIDGLSEATRFRVNKRITDDMIVEYFKLLIEERNHVRFKMFYIFGYPWEKLSDFDSFANLMDRLRQEIKLHQSVNIRIKWTPFIPQPCTPLGDCNPIYDFKMVDNIRVWHALNDRPRHRYQANIFFEADAGGPMMFESHRRQVELTRGDERILFQKINPIYPLHRGAAE